MINRFFRKYLSIIFVIATFMGVFHHHNDLKQHNDCKICTIQSSIANADTPVDTVYITKLEIFSESIATAFASLHVQKIYNPEKARAPPKIS